MSVCGIFPSPSAPNAAAAGVQYTLKPLVDDLIHLYEEWIVIKTNNYPAGKTYRSTFYFNSDLFSIGRRVRVVIIAIRCDHPAMCSAVHVGLQTIIMRGHRAHDVRLLGMKCKRLKGYRIVCTSSYSVCLQSFSCIDTVYERRTGDEHRRRVLEYIACSYEKNGKLTSRSMASNMLSLRDSDTSI